MLEAANTPLYDGCREGHSQLLLAARFMNIKADNNMTESCMDSWAELFTEYLPEGNQATDSYYETESLMRKLGLPYYTYDVCVDNCMPFWKENENLDHCKFCAKPRYKSSEGRTRIPFIRMWYLPVADRLKRMYQSERTTSLMRWHAGHDSKDGEMCHPSNAAEWKNFNQLNLKVNPRNTIKGKYNVKELVILQQITDDEVVGTIEEITVDNLADVTHPFEEIDFEIEDTEAEDEFHCNVSTSDDEDEEFE